MQVKQLVQAFSRAIAIYLVTRALVLIQHIIVVLRFQEPPFSNMSAYLIAPIVVNLALAYLLWFRAEMVGDLLLPQVGEKEALLSTANWQVIQRMAFIVVGVIVFSTALPNMIRTVVATYLLPASAFENEVYQAETYSHLVGEALKTIVGLLLVLGAHRLSDFLTKMKNT